jgi:hypothetical protein
MAVAYVKTLCFKQKLQWLTFQHFVLTTNGSGSYSNTLLQPETAVAHIPALCFHQKLQYFMFQNFASAKNCCDSYSKAVFQNIAGFDI